MLLTPIRLAGALLLLLSARATTLRGPRSIAAALGEPWECPGSFSVVVNEVHLLVVGMVTDVSVEIVDASDSTDWAALTVSVVGPDGTLAARTGTSCVATASGDAINLNQLSFRVCAGWGADLTGAVGAAGTGPGGAVLTYGTWGAAPPLGGVAGCAIPTAQTAHIGTPGLTSV